MSLNQDSCTTPSGPSEGSLSSRLQGTHHCINVFASTFWEILLTDGMVALTHACSPIPERALPFPCSVRGHRPSPSSPPEVPEPSSRDRGTGYLPGTPPFTNQLRNPYFSGREGAKQTAVALQLGPLRQWWWLRGVSHRPDSILFLCTRGQP